MYLRSSVKTTITGVECTSLEDFFYCLLLKMFTREKNVIGLAYNNLLIVPTWTIYLPTDYFNMS